MFLVGIAKCSMPVSLAEGAALLALAWRSSCPACAIEIFLMPFVIQQHTLIPHAVNYQPD